ncbi:uncharacterized protein LTR77_009614 [Saxophila tyrrhenica]|uniref:Mit1 C-terminal Zn finger 2 domain-containing protein n=1 Tax=Saxophila tyrrhenica TaxID=1690608 RepID=A0AAV9P0X1_9PEZI|nr:hypothetical protein LTR77_009614 [Saxophila tyrrhenica]
MPSTDGGFMQHPQNAIIIDNGVNCVACRSYHPVGSCPLKLAGVETCNLCGMAHFGSARVCPHIQSETQVRQMLEALKHSNEPEHIIYAAKKYLKGLKGSLVQIKKQKEARSFAAREVQMGAQYQRARGPLLGGVGWD